MAESPYNPNKWDVFISHATEDKDDIARPLARALQDAGLKVWFDEFTLKVGDSLSRSIEHGLAHSKYGIVIISNNFLSKEWTQKELAGLVAKEDSANTVILPVWHHVTANLVKSHSPILADRLAVQSSVGIPELTKQLLQAMNLPFTFKGKDISGKTEDISGIWLGKTGRLRLFQINEDIEGDYDWNGHTWAGHVKGQFQDNVFRFQWWWNLSPEMGNGFFSYNPENQALRGGWAFTYEKVDVFTLSPAILTNMVQPWSYYRHE